MTNCPRHDDFLVMDFSQVNNRDMSVELDKPTADFKSKERGDTKRDRLSANGETAPDDSSKEGGTSRQNSEYRPKSVVGDSPVGSDRLSANGEIAPDDSSKEGGSSRPGTSVFSDDVKNSEHRQKSVLRSGASDHTTTVPPINNGAPFNDKMIRPVVVDLFRQQTHFILAQHGLASKHLASRHFAFFTVPMAVLNMAAGLLAFLATSSEFGFTNFVATTLTSIAGSISFVVVFLQTLSSKCKYDIRAEMHGSTAIDLDHLRGDLENTANEALVMAWREGEGETDNGNVEDELNVIKKRYAQCLKGCKSNLPQPIGVAFQMLDSRINRFLTTFNRRDLSKLYGEQYTHVIYFEACDTLEAKFLCSWWWPLFLPNPTRAVKDTMDEIKNSLDDMGASLTPPLVKPSSNIGQIGPNESYPLLASSRNNRTRAFFC